MTAHEIVAKAHKIPHVPAAALKLVELLDKPEDNAEEVTQLIKSDALLTAKLLRACNSAAFGLSQQASSVDQALLLLGYGQVLGIVLSLGFGGPMKTALPAYGIEENELAHHAFSTAMVSEAVVKSGMYGEAEASVAFTAGLLHDIGKLIMAQVLSGQAKSAIRMHMSAEGLGSIPAEREVLGTDHAEVGSCLLHMWRLPEWIVEAVGNHHQPILEPHPKLSAVVHVANRVVHNSGSGPDSSSYAFNGGEKVLEVLEMNLKVQDHLQVVLRDCEARTKDLLAIA